MSDPSFKSEAERHKFNIAEMKGLVKMLRSPVAVFAYGDKSKAQNIIVDIQHEGKNFVIGLSLRPVVNGDVLDINSIRTVYQKDNHEWMNWINQGKLLYVDKNKIQVLFGQHQMNAGDVAYLDLDSVRSIAQNFVNPQSQIADETDDYAGEFELRFKREIASVGKYAGELRNLAHGMKRGDMRSMVIGADLMSPLIPENAVIVPMPNHEGKPIRTMLLGMCISGVRDDVDVVPALLVNPHEGSYHDKKLGKRPNVVMRRDWTAKIPKGRPVVVIDNVIASGATWEAAKSVLPDAQLVTLADASRKARREEMSDIKSLSDFLRHPEPPMSMDAFMERFGNSALEEQMRFKRKSYANPNTVDSVVPKSERGVFWGEFDRLLSDYKHSNGENPSAGGLFTSNAYYLYDIIDGETPVDIRRYDLNDDNRDFIVGFDRKYKAEIYRGSRTASGILDAILAKGVGSVRGPNGIDGEAGVGNGGLASQGMLEDEGTSAEEQDNVGSRGGEDAESGIRLKRKEPKYERAKADDSGVAWANKAGILSRFGIEMPAPGASNKDYLDRGARIANDPDAVSELLDRARNGEGMNAQDIATLINVVANRANELTSLRNTMDGTNANERGTEEEVSNAATERIISILNAGSTVGQALQMLKMGIAMTGVKDSYVYLESEVKSRMAKQGLTPEVTDEVKAMIDRQVEELKKVNTALQEKLSAASDENARLKTANETLEAYRRQIESNISASVKKRYGITDTTAMNAAVYGLGKFFSRANTARLARSENGGASVTLNDEIRQAFAAAIVGAGGNRDNARRFVSETFGTEAASMFDEYAKEIGATPEADNTIRRGRDSAVKTAEERFANQKKRLERKRNDTIRKMDDFYENDELRRKAVGQYIRSFMKYVIQSDPTLTNEEVLQRMADEANAIDPRGNYDVNEMLAVANGEDGYTAATRDAVEKRLADLAKAFKLLQEGKVDEAAKLAGIKHTTETDILERQEKALKKVLAERERKLFEILENPMPDQEAQVAAIKRLQEEIKEIVDTIKLQRKEIAAAEKKAKTIETLQKQLKARQDELASLVDGNDASVRGELDGMIAGLKEDIRAVTREIGAQRAIIDEINELDRRMRENDFETPKARKRVNPMKSPEVMRLLAQREAMRKRFAAERAAYQYRKLSKPVQFWKDFWQILGESKGVAGSMDLSSMFRQGGQLTFAHPLLFAKNFRKTIEAFKSADKANDLWAEIQSRPNWKYYERAGIDFTDWGAGAVNADDRFSIYDAAPAQSERKVLGFYRKIVHSKPISAMVGMSERAFAMYLNLMRADAFDKIVASSTFGDASKMTDSQLKALGNFLNVATQRGMVDKGGKLGKAIALANDYFWSPRNIISRFQYLAETAKIAMPWADPYGDKTLRKLYAKELARYLAGTATMIAVAKFAADLLKDDDEPPEDLEWDPRSSEFLRVKFGNTRVDFLSGLQQVIVLGSRWISGKNKNSRGQLRDSDRKELLAKFIRQKLSPAASFFWDLSSQETFNRQDLVWDSLLTDNKEEKSAWRHFAGYLVPLTFGDVIDQAKYSGVGNTTITSMLTILGAGVNAYDPLTYKQLVGDFHYYKRQYLEADEENKQRLLRYHPMLRKAPIIDALIKRQNAVKKRYDSYSKLGVGSDNARITLEDARQAVVNAILGVRQ